MTRLAYSLFFFTFFLIALPAYAQTCNPACQTGTICIYVGSAGQTQCVPQQQGGTVDELTVTASSGTSFATLTTRIVSFFDTYVIPLLYAIAFLVFVIGLVRYFFLGGEENRQKGRNFAVWGFIGFVVLFGVWSIVKLLLTIIPGT